jgi:hypothetical protein
VAIPHRQLYIDSDFSMVTGKIFDIKNMPSMTDRVSGPRYFSKAAPYRVGGATTPRASRLLINEFTVKNAVSAAGNVWMPVLKIALKLLQRG